MRIVHKTPARSLARLFWLAKPAAKPLILVARRRNSCSFARPPAWTSAADCVTKWRQHDRRARLSIELAAYWAASRLTADRVDEDVRLRSHRSWRPWLLMATSAGV